VTTRDKLLAAAAEALARDGLSGVSARAIACRAGVNQALVFYHFGSVSDLLEAAVRRSVDLAVASYRDRFADVGSLGELLALGRDLHRMERRRGNVAQMAQVMSGAQRDPILAKAGRYAMQRWTSEIEAVLARLLPGSVVEGLVDPGGGGHAAGGGGVDRAGAESALDTLDAMGAVLAALDDLGPMATRAVRGRVRRVIG
jgi:AcrR family transcriptional regulator